MQVIRTAAALMVRSMVLSAQSACQQRVLHLVRSAGVGGEGGELARLRDENRRLKSENRILKARDADAPHRKRYSPMQRLQILWDMAYYHIPRCRVKEHFRIAKSTLYRWLHVRMSRTRDTALRALWRADEFLDRTGRSGTQGLGGDRQNEVLRLAASSLSSAGKIAQTSAAGLSSWWDRGSRIT